MPRRVSPRVKDASTSFLSWKKIFQQFIDIFWTSPKFGHLAIYNLLAISPPHITRTRKGECEHISLHLSELLRENNELPCSPHELTDTHDWSVLTWPDICDNFRIQTCNDIANAFLLQHSAALHVFFNLSLTYKHVHAHIKTSSLTLYRR